MKQFKYLKGFNESFNTEGIIQDVKDILIELEDSGFEIIVKTPISRCVYIEIVKKKSGEEDAFLWSDVEDYLNRVCHYLSGFGFKLFAGWGKTETVKRRSQVPRQGEMDNWYASDVETETKCWVKFISDFPIN